jgi:hypothetical protein
MNRDDAARGASILAVAYCVINLIMVVYGTGMLRDICSAASHLPHMPIPPSQVPLQRPHHIWIGPL